MRILAVENYRGTGLGLVGQALDEAGAAVDLRRMWDGDRLPDDPSGHDGIIVLGGGQSAVDDAAHPYLPHLARLMRTFGDSGRAVLGICLGSQILARGYGANNLLGRPIEIGWLPVRSTAEGADDPLIGALGPVATPFHWHTDSFSLPEGAVRLASSERTENQGFRIGAKVYGIQFHFEADRTIVDTWTSTYRHLLTGGAADWPDRHAADQATLGAAADRVGLEIARAFVALAGR